VVTAKDELIKVAAEDARSGLESKVGGVTARPAHRLVLVEMPFLG